jgi:hypothetical protein
MKRSLVTFVAALILLAGLTAAFAPLGGTFDLSWNTIDGGGGTSSAGGFDLAGTIGQHDAGETLTGGGFELAGGFWPSGGGPTATPATLTDFTVAFGSLISGTLQDLVDSDDARLQTRSIPGFTSEEANLMELRIGAETTEQSPGAIDLTLEGRLNQPGGTVRVRFRNWTTNGFVQVHQYPIGFTEAVETITGIDATNRVRASDGRIEVSLRHSVFATFSALGFDSFTDQVAIGVL